MLVRFSLHDAYGNGIRILCCLQIESIASAGLHDFNEIPTGISYTVLADTKGGMKVAKELLEERQLEVLWVSMEHEDPVFYQGCEKISEDYFWATVLPFHECRLELGGVNGSSMLQISCTPKLIG